MPVQVQCLQASKRLPGIDAGDPTTEWSPGAGELDGHSRVLCGRLDMGTYELGIGDFDCDGVVDLFDFANWSSCATGLNTVVVGAACGVFDFDASSVSTLAPTIECTYSTTYVVPERGMAYAQRDYAEWSIAYATQMVRTADPA